MKCIYILIYIYEYISPKNGINHNRPGYCIIVDQYLDGSQNIRTYRHCSHQILVNGTHQSPYWYLLII